MTVSYRPTQDQDPQEPGSQHDLGAGPHNGIDQQPGSTPRLSEPIRRKVVIKPPATPPSVRWFSSQESHGQNSSTMQEQVVEQLPTGALPAPAPLTSNRAQTIEQLRAAALSTPPNPPGVPAPGVPASNRQLGVEQTHRPAVPAPAAVSNWQKRVAQVPTAALPGGSPAGNSAKTREPGMLRNAPGAGYMAYTASPAEMAQQEQGPKPEVENGNTILYRTH